MYMHRQTYYINDSEFINNNYAAIGHFVNIHTKNLALDSQNIFVITEHALLKCLLSSIDQLT